VPWRRGCDENTDITAARRNIGVESKEQCEGDLSAPRATCA